MNPIILSSLFIPGAIAFGLVALLIRERYNLLPKKTNATEKMKANNNVHQTIRDYQKDRQTIGRRHPDDFLDLSGGTFGI